MVFTRELSYAMTSSIQWLHSNIVINYRLKTVIYYLAIIRLVHQVHIGHILRYTSQNKIL